MNVNTIFYNEDLSIKSQTTQPIRAYAEQANTIEIYAPVSSNNVGYFALQGLKNSVVNPRMGVVELLTMYPLTAETVNGVLYSRWNAIIPGAVLNDATLMKCTALRFGVEFWYLGDEVLGVRKYDTEVVLDIIAFLEADFPTAVAGDYVRVIDTNTDFVFDGTDWADYETQHTVAIEKSPSQVCDFSIEKGISTTDPTHAPTNTELILQEIQTLHLKDTSLDADIAEKSDAFQRYDAAYLGVTIQTDIFPVAGAEETVMGRIEVARDINPATVSDIPTIIFFHGVVVNTAGVLSMKANSGKAFVVGKAINGTGKVGFSATGMWVWIPISDNATKKNGLKAFISSASSVAGQSTNGVNRITTITAVNTAPSGTSIVADMSVTWGQHITLASGETITLSSKIYSALKVDALLAAILNGTTPITSLDVNGNADISGTLAVHGLLTAWLGLDMKAQKIINIADGTAATDGVNKGQMDASDALKANLAGGNTITGSQVFNNTIYTVRINYDGIEIYEAGVLYLKMNSLGFYKNPIIAASGNYLLSGIEIAALISAHNGTTAPNTAHPYIRARVAAVEKRIDGMTERGNPYGIVNELTANLLAMSVGDRDTFINAAIVAKEGNEGYTPTAGDVVCDKGVGDDVDYHVWQYNGATAHWVDEGQESVSKASDSVHGIVKGGLAHANGLKYTEIIGGEIHNLLADKSLGVYDETTGLLHYTYEEIKALEDRLDAVEPIVADNTDRLDIVEPIVDNHEERLDVVEPLVTDQGNRLVVVENIMATTNQVNKAEVDADGQPTATLTKASPTTALAHKTHNMNSLKTDGATIKNLIKDGNFAQAVTHPNWSTQNATVSYHDGWAWVLASAVNGRIYETVNPPIISGHVYFVSIKYQHTQANVVYYDYISSAAGTPVALTNDGLVHTFTRVSTADRTGTAIVSLRDSNSSGWQTFKQGNTVMVDLTELGTHPTLAVAWNTLTAEALATYIGKLAFTGATSGLHSATPDEVLVKGTVQNQVELKRFSGRTVKEMALNPDFAAALSATDWVAADCGTPTVSGSKITLTATAQNGGISQTLTTISGNKYYVVALVKASSSNVKLVGTNPTSSAAHTGGGAFELLHFVMTANNTTSVITLRDENASGWAAVECYYIQFIALTGVGIAHITTPTEAAAYYNISTATLTAYAFGLTNSLPTAIVTKDGSAVQIASYAIARAEWPTAQATYGAPCLPCGIADYIDGRTAKYWRNIGIEIFDGDESWTASTVGTNCVLFYLTNALQNSLLTDGHTTTALSNYFTQKYGADEEFFRAGTTATSLFVNILKTRIGGAAGLTEFKAWLSTHNLQVQYLRTATDHDLTSPTTFRLNAIEAGTIEITGALNPTTCYDIGEYYSHATDISAIGELASLPSGVKSGFETKVDDNPLNTTFQSRIYQFVKRAKTLSLPTDAQANGWAKMVAPTEMIVNGIDWTDSNVDGLADNWTAYLGGGTYSIVSGKQRITENNAGYSGIYQSQTITYQHKYLMKLDLVVSSASGLVDIKQKGLSTSDILTGLGTGTHYVVFDGVLMMSSIQFAFNGSSSAGDYFELDNVSMQDLTAYNLGAGFDATAAQYSAFFAQATNSVWEIDLSYWDGGSTLTLPASCADVANAYISDTNRPHVALNTLITGAAIGAAISPNSKLYFVTTNAVADTIAEAYAYYVANPPKVVIGITEETTNVPINYIPMCGDNDATVVIKSSTVAEASDWEAVVPLDADLIINPAQDDLAVPATLAKVGANAKPDFDYTNIGLLFPDNDEAEIAYFTVQMPHGWKEGTTIYPHVHARLTTTGQPIMKLDYKWYEPTNGVPAGSFSTYVMNVNTAGTWSTGVLSTRINGVGGIAGTGHTTSSILVCKLYRETTGNDYTGDLLVDQFDIHYTKYRFGVDVQTA